MVSKMKNEKGKAPNNAIPDFSEKRNDGNGADKGYSC